MYFKWNLSRPTMTQWIDELSYTKAYYIISEFFICKIVPLVGESHPLQDILNDFETIFKTWHTCNYAENNEASL